jgi:hypothetical protein
MRSAGGGQVHDRVGRGQPVPRPLVRIPVSFFLRDRDPGAPPVSIEFRTASSPWSSRYPAAQLACGSARPRHR